MFVDFMVWTTWNYMTDRIDLFRVMQLGYVSVDVTKPLLVFQELSKK